MSNLTEIYRLCPLLLSDEDDYIVIMKFTMKMILGLLGTAALAAGTASGSQAQTPPAAVPQSLPQTIPQPPPQTEIDGVSQYQSLSVNERIVPQSEIQVKLSFAPVVKQTAPAVVNVYSERKVKVRNRDPFMEFFGRGVPRERVESSLGSGVIVRTNGIIVTNAHVVKGATELRVVLGDRREFSAEIIAQDEETDLAVLKIDTKGETMPVLTVSTKQELEIGDIVLAIGNPFGVGQSVTSGIVSATSRTGVTGLGSFIQTDAAVNPGNSGGALIDLDGELVGVNTAIFSRSGGSNGIGFAIPAELVARAVESAISEGRIIRPWIGARSNGIDTTMAQALGLDRSRGTIIADIYPDGPAEAAGLEEGDVILSVNGTDVNDDSGLQFKLATLRPGENVSVNVWRDGNERIFNITTTMPVDSPARDERDLDGYNPLVGAVVGNLNPVFAEENNFDPYLQGVVIKQIRRRSIAYANGLRRGDLILKVNGADIQSTEQLDTVLKSVPDGDETWSLSIDRRGRTYNVPVRYLPRAQ